MSLNHRVEIGLVLLIFITSIVYLMFKCPENKYACTNLNQAQDALKALNDWMKWLVALSGAAIAGMAKIQEKIASNPLNNLEKTIGLFTLCLFGMSILVAVFVAGFLPDVMLRLKENDCDFLEMSLIGWRKHPYVGPAITVVYTLFGVGALCFSFFIAIRINKPNDNLRL